MEVIPPGYTRISSPRTLLWKWLFPGMYIAAWIGLATQQLIEGLMQGHIPVFYIVIFLGIAICFIFVFRFTVFRTMDKVYRCGDVLLIFNGGHSERVNLADVENVEFKNPIRGPLYAFITLAHETRWGHRLRFMPDWGWTDNSWPPKVVTDLEKRAVELHDRK